MRKISAIRRSACIGAAVLLLGACGQADKAETVPSETLAESTVTESQETTAAEDEESKEAVKETTVQEETDAADETEKEDAKEDASDEESEEETSAEESAGKQEETSLAAQETESQAPAQKTAKSVKDIYGEISQTVALNSPMLVPDDFILNYYGIDVSTLDEYVFSMSEAAISAETVVILKARDGGDTAGLSASLQTVIDQKRSEMENYLPDQFQIVDKSSVQVQGNYVYLVISEQADAISRIIQADIQ